MPGTVRTRFGIHQLGTNFHAGTLMSGVVRGAPGGPRRLNVPQPARVWTGPGGRPLEIDRLEVMSVAETWLVEDRWWTDAPIRRRYWEVVTVDGRNLVVFRDLDGGRWFRQR